MARTRQIKPDFFADDELAEVQPLGRLLFIGLWTLADRDGRLDDRPRKIKALLLPFDDCDADGLLNELSAGGFIVRYQAADEPFIAIRSWAKHARPFNKEPDSVIPPPPSLPLARAKLAPSCSATCRPVTVTVTDTETVTVASTSVDVDHVDDEHFDIFWSAYPTKQGKARAQRRWKKMSLTDRRLAVKAARRLAANVARCQRPDAEHCWNGDTFIGPQELYREWADEVPPRYRPATAATSSSDPTAWHGQVESCSKCGASLEGDPDRVPVQERDGSVCWLCGKCGEGVPA